MLAGNLDVASAALFNLPGTCTMLKLYLRVFSFRLILTLNRVLQSIFTLRVCYPLLLFRVKAVNVIVRFYEYIESIHLLVAFNLKD